MSARGRRGKAGVQGGPKTRSEERGLAGEKSRRTRSPKEKSGLREGRKTGIHEQLGEEIDYVIKKGGRNSTAGKGREARIIHRGNAWEGKREKRRDSSHLRRVGEVWDRVRTHLSRVGGKLPPALKQKGILERGSRKKGKRKGESHTSESRTE